MSTINQVEINGVVHDIVGPNPNLLINSNFANPVNQRGETTKTSEGFWIDRWYVSGFPNYSISSEGIDLNSGNHASLSQLVECDLKGKVVTLTVKYIDNGVSEIKSFVFTVNTLPTSSSDQVLNEYSLRYNHYTIKILQRSTTELIIVSLESEVPRGYDSITIEWVKLELGSVATPYVPRLYLEELILCGILYDSLYRYNDKYKHELVSNLPSTPDPNTFYYIPKKV